MQPGILRRARVLASEAPPTSPKELAVWEPILMGCLSNRHPIRSISEAPATSGVEMTIPPTPGDVGA